MRLTEVPNQEVIKTIYEHPHVNHADRQRLYYYCNLVQRSNGKIDVSYTQKTYNGKKYGRYYADENLMLPCMYQKSSLRATLFANTEYDIDIVNAHPTILQQLYIKTTGNNKDVIPYLTEYVENRDAVIDKIKINPEAIERYNADNKDNKTKKDLVKKLFTIVIYGGSIKTWMKDYNLEKCDFDLNGTYNKFSKEIKSITSALLNNDKFADMVNDIKQEFNADKKAIHNGRILSVIMQEEERKIVMLMMDVFAKSKTFISSAYIYDGFQVRKNDLSPKAPKDTKKINGMLAYGMEEIKKELGYSIKFISKPFNDKLPKLPISTFDLLIPPFIENPSHTTFGDIYRDRLDDKVIERSGITYLYCDGRWLQETTDSIYGQIYRKIYDDLCYQIEVRQVNKKVAKQIIKFIGSRNNTVASFRNAIDTARDNHVKFDFQPHLLNAPNGTFNLETMELQPHNPKDYITKCIKSPIEFSETAGKESYERIYQMLRNWFDVGNEFEESEQTLEYFLFILSTALHGANSMEKAIILLGKLSRNGKSTFIDMLKMALNDYVGSLPLAYFTTIDSKPEAPKPALMETIGCRFIEVAECDTSDQNGRIIPQQFKAWTGKDLHKARDLYARKNDAVQFRPQGTLLMPCNDYIQFQKEESAISNRLIHIDFPNWFGDESMNGWTLEKSYCKNIDPLFKKKVLDPQVSSDLIHAMLYLRQKHGPVFSKLEMPKFVKKAQAEAMDEIDTVRAWCDKYIVPDNQPFSINNSYDQFLIETFKDSNLAGKERVLTLDFMYSRYKVDVDKPLDNQNFMKRIYVLYNNIFDKSKRTRLFGGRKYYLPHMRYNAYDYSAEEGVIVQDENEEPWEE